MKLPVRHRIVTANLYVGNRAPLAGVHRLIAAIRPWRLPDSIGIQEVSDHLEELAKVDGYQLVANVGAGRLERTNAVLVRDGLDVVHREFTVACEGTGTVYTPKRTIALVGYRKRGVRVMHISTHLHVVPEEKLPYRTIASWPRAAFQYAKHANQIVDIADKYADEGWTVFVTADGNTRPRDGVQDWTFSLYKLLTHYGFRVERHGVDLIASDPERAGFLGSKIISKRVFGSDDHDAIAARYKRRKP